MVGSEIRRVGAPSCSETSRRFASRLRRVHGGSRPKWEFSWLNRPPSRCLPPTRSGRSDLGWLAAPRPHPIPASGQSCSRECGPNVTRSSRQQARRYTRREERLRNEAGLRPLLESGLPARNGGWNRSGNTWSKQRVLRTLGMQSIAQAMLWDGKPQSDNVAGWVADAVDGISVKRASNRLPGQGSERADQCNQAPA